MGYKWYGGREIQAIMSRSWFTGKQLEEVAKGINRKQIKIVPKVLTLFFPSSGRGLRTQRFVLLSCFTLMKRIFLEYTNMSNVELLVLFVQFYNSDCFINRCLLLSRWLYKMYKNTLEESYNHKKHPKNTEGISGNYQ